MFGTAGVSGLDTDVLCLRRVVVEVWGLEERVGALQWGQYIVLVGAFISPADIQWHMFCRTGVMDVCCDHCCFLSMELLSSQFETS